LSFGENQLTQCGRSHGILPQTAWVLQLHLGKVKPSDSGKPLLDLPKLQPIFGLRYQQRHRKRRGKKKKEKRKKKKEKKKDKKKKGQKDKKKKRRKTRYSSIPACACEV